MTPAPITIRADCSDTELNAAVAEHVAGWTMVRIDTQSGKDPSNPERLFPNFPPFCTDANAVLPLLEPFLSWIAHQIIAGIRIKICFRGEQTATNPLAHCYAEATAPTFCRAACYALLRANGVTVVE
jgi:hypothetical protein